MCLLRSKLYWFASDNKHSNHFPLDDFPFFSSTNIYQFSAEWFIKIIGSFLQKKKIKHDSSLEWDDECLYIINYHVTGIPKYHNSTINWSNRAKHMTYVSKMNMLYTMNTTFRRVINSYRVGLVWKKNSSWLTYSLILGRHLAVLEIWMC